LRQIGAKNPFVFNIKKYDFRYFTNIFLDETGRSTAWRRRRLDFAFSGRRLKRGCPKLANVGRYRSTSPYFQKEIVAARARRSNDPEFFSGKPERGFEPRA
jgi:hypothetical protein